MRPTRTRMLCGLTLLSMLAVAVSSSAARPSEVEDKSYVATLNGPCGIAIDGYDRKIIADTGNNRVIVLDEDFEPVGVIEGVRRGGLLERPHGVACDAQNRIVVADTGNHCVKVYDANGYHQLTIGRHGQPGSRVGALRAPEGVTIDPKGNIIVFDTGNKRVQIFDSRGDYIMQFRGGTYSVERLVGSPADPQITKDTGEIVFERPVRGCVLGDGKLVVADLAAGRVSVWDYSTSKRTARPVKYAEPKENAPGVWVSDVAYDPRHNEVLSLQTHPVLAGRDLLLVAGVDARELDAYPEALRLLKSSPTDWLPYYRTNNFMSGRFLEPRGVAVDSRGNVVVVDRRLDFAVQISRRQIEARWGAAEALAAHTIAKVTPNSAMIEYTTFEAVPTLLEYGPSGDVSVEGPHAYTARIKDNVPTRTHRVRLGGLEPGTRYTYRYLTTRNAYPREHFSEARVVTTRPRPGETAILKLDVLVVLFTDVVTMPDPETIPKDADGNPIMPEAPGPGPMTPEEIARIEAALERVRGFFWINSHMKLNLRFDVLEVSDHLERLPFEKGAVFSLADRRKLDEIIAAHGRRPRGRRGGIIVVEGARRWDPERQAWVLSDHAATTWGTAADGLGISAISAGGDTTWRLVCEYGRQLALMGAYTGHAAHPKKGCFRSSLLDADAGFSDGEAVAARAVEPNAYLANFYGAIAIVKDADGDGFPDDDPACPFDEKRFGTRSYDTDSDGDGVDDLAEAMFSQWLTLDFVVLGARTAEPYSMPAPYSADTDGDGISDLLDAFPLIALSPNAAKSDVVVDGTIGPGEWDDQAVRPIDDPEFKGAFRINWCDEGLCFAVEQRLSPEQAKAYATSPKPIQVTIELDGNNDGFTAGSDNTTIRLDAQPGGTAQVTTTHADYSDPSKAVWTENSVIKPETVRAAWMVSGDRLVLEFIVPRNLEAGLNGVAGEQIGLSVELRPEGAEHALRLFEPQTLFGVTLK